MNQKSINVSDITIHGYLTTKLKIQILTMCLKALFVMLNQILNSLFFYCIVVSISIKPLKPFVAVRDLIEMKIDLQQFRMMINIFQMIYFFDLIIKYEGFIFSSVKYA